MHYCCVRLCGKNTKTSGVNKDGISFHRFPKCPNMKEIWINATKRSDDWFPSPSSVVCSRHFKSEYFKLTKGNRRILYTSAVRTLHLPTVIPGDGSVAQSHNTFSEVAKVTQALPTAETIVQATTDFAFPSTSNQTTISSNIRPDQNTEDCLETISNFSTPRKKRLRITIADLSQKLKQLKIKVKRLQSSNRTYKKKIISLKSQLKELQDKYINVRLAYLSKKKQKKSESN